MEELFSTPPSADAGGRVLIVDDDPITAGMLGATLTAAGHEIEEVYSGEEALARLATPAHAQPEVIFLDIEMSGIDGYETCSQLRALDALRDVPVIFVSGHDGLEDRLRAYDAGGDDFIAKPFEPEELLRKAALSIRHYRRQRATDMERSSSFSTAMTALNSLGESGATIKFSRNALGCRTLDALAMAAIESMRTLGLESHVQLRAPTGTLSMTPRGPASPLEESVFEKMSSMGRIFSFKTRTIVNYDAVSLLVTNMPVHDSDLCGRIRDHVTMIAEAAEHAVDNINLRNEAVMRAGELRALASQARQAVEDLRRTYREMQIASRIEFESMGSSIEGMYVHLGLTNKQEYTISDTVRTAVDHVLALFERSSELDKTFANIVDALTKAGEYTVSQENEVQPTIEIW